MSHDPPRAVTSGDSDSIACIAGAFAGAHHGIEAWPAGWVERIEYRDRILAIAGGLASWVSHPNNPNTSYNH